MTLLHLISREIAHRKLSFALGLASVTVAAGCLVGAVTAMNVYEQRTQQILAAKQTEVDKQVQQVRDEVAARGKKLADEMREITKKLGFNIVILPKDQNLSDLFAEDYAGKYMPEANAEKLAKSVIVTITHLLPSLEQRVQWPERNNRTMILIGTRGEVPQSHVTLKQPILDAVPKGQMVMGAELARTEQIKEGDTVTLMGETFTVSKVYEPRGDKRDITAWIDLKQAQAMLDKPGLINSIWALECKCAFADLPKVRKEIEAILPDTQVIERGSIALARAEARVAAEDAAQRMLAETERAGRETIALEERNRAKLASERESLFAMLAPLVIAAAAVWVGLLTLANVRQRRAEIGVLRALGLRSRQVLSVFLAKAAIMGAVGAVVGVLLGAIVGVWGGARLEGVDAAGIDWGRVLDVKVLAAVVALSPIVAMLASWLPAMAAAQQDPAVVLREE